jgi:adenosyl cobinamide kinase/adenosyl cobinamide phosphate guanylyltransferase
MGKSLNEYTLLKQGIVVGLFLAITLFGKDIRGTFSQNDDDLSERVARVEMQNESHAVTAEQLQESVALVYEVQKIQASVVVQVENLTTIVNAMQDREYARLSNGDN